MTAAELGTEIIYLCETYGWTATEAADHVADMGIPQRVDLESVMNHRLEDFGRVHENLMLNGNGNGNGKVH